MIGLARPIQMKQILFLGMVLAAMPLSAAGPLEEARDALAKGDYAKAAAQAAEALEKNAVEEDAHVIAMRALMATGQYAKANGVATNALKKVSGGVRVRLAAHEVFLYNQNNKRAAVMLEEINRLAGYRAWAYRNAPDLVTLGRTALKLGGDPKLVLERVFDAARKADPKYPGTALAIGALALDKNDYELAGRTFQLALKEHPKHAGLHFGAARAFVPSDRKNMMGHLQQALAGNTNHIPARLLLADGLIDREAYSEAAELLDSALKVNPHHPKAWAYRAVLAHLKNDRAAEKAARMRALAHWTNNPAVDHLIGRKLSQKYRFAEGSAYQRQALAFDPKHLPARIQLAQDLLRLGLEKEGWAMAAQAHKDDGYDVTTFNLVTLKDTLDTYTTLTNRNFILRMAPTEAAIYGPRALKLLDRAHRALCDKYGLELPQPTTVEMFEDQKDFGVRTFGMPDNPGFLGVCFGCVITANSPASQMPDPANWESVLWHEFCHTVTLALTKNKMPRWLSEGISVYEERQASPAWGQRMTPRYREMILGGELTPISRLSGAFLSPKTGVHMQFAYYQSSLVVEYIIDRFGQEAVRKVLRDLGTGVPINTAIARHTEPMAKLEPAFDAFAKKRAEALAPKLNWTKPTPADLKAGVAAFAKQHPKNFYILTREARRLLKERKWEEAKVPCRELIRLFPHHRGGGNPYEMLARAHRALNESQGERAALAALAAMTDDNHAVYRRLMDLAAATGDWTAVRVNAERTLAVNPLMPQPHRQLARAAEALNETGTAITAWQTVLKLDPLDPAEAHFRLARLLQARDHTRAKRHVLMALEEAPRFREAHFLLLKLQQRRTPESQPKKEQE